MRQLALVAFYGPKPIRVAELIWACQERIAERLGSVFEPYDIAQVHATIVSLQRVPGTPLANLNFMRYRTREREMDLRGLIDSLQSSGDLPFHIQIGGFGKADRSFLSRGHVPYERSFSLQGDKVVLMGWPVCYPARPGAVVALESAAASPTYPTTLEDIRRKMQRYNVLHAYHRRPGDVDNDLYMRLGLLHEAPSDSLLFEQLQTELRDYLASQPPLIAEVSQANLFFASWDDETLPIASTLSWPVSSDQISAELLASLYE